MNENLLYQRIGSEYLLLPAAYQNLVRDVYDAKSSNSKHLIPSLEQAIKKMYNNYRSVDYSGLSRKNSAERKAIQILLQARRNAINKNYSISEEDFRRFETINTTLLDLSKKLKHKILSLYQSWLDTEENDWRNDCQIQGRIIAEGWKQLETDNNDCDKGLMMSIIEEMTDHNLLEIEFSGNPKDKIDDSYRWDFQVEGGCLFSLGGESPYGDFTKCQAFENLYKDSLYSHQDLLQIASFWADASITHQRIVTPEGLLM